LSLKKIRIGKHIIDNQAFLAPMAGITDASFRSLAIKFGAGLVVSEMIASASLGAGQREMVRRLKNDFLSCANLPHIVQLSGNQERWLELGAKMAFDAGADIIDINFGCPSKKVTNGLAGSALMREPDKALRLIETVVKATDLPVTIKMRLGWDEDNLNAKDIAKSAANAGVKMISVHGRTRQQFYKGKARWGLISDVVDAVNIPIVVNGDITNIKTAKMALELSGADALMIGRASYGQPWIVGQVGAVLAEESPIATPKDAALLELMLEHYEMMMSEYGYTHGVRVARKHLNWYLAAADIKVDKQIMHQLLTNKEAKQVKNILRKIFQKHMQEAA
jgi:tRNA-dihydrouridine synthase B